MSETFQPRPELFDEVKEYSKRHFEGNSTYAYYLIATAISCVGFSVYQTKDDALKWEMLPLGIATLCWALSIFSGLEYLAKGMLVLFQQSGYYRVVSGNDDLAGQNPYKIAIGEETIRKLMIQTSMRAGKYAMIQKWTFLAGMTAFLVWQIIHMAHNVK